MRIHVSDPNRRASGGTVKSRDSLSSGVKIGHISFNPHLLKVAFISSDRSFTVADFYQVHSIFFIFLFEDLNCGGTFQSYQ